MKRPQLRRPKRSADLADQVFDRLIEAIVTHELRPGTPLREAKLAKDWGISRTPLREAIREAASTGLLELRPNRRPIIRQLSADDVAKLYTVRESLELLALDLAFERIAPSEVQELNREAGRLQSLRPGTQWTKRALSLDSRLHGLWFAQCDNRWLRQVLEQQWTFIRILQQVVARDPEAIRRALEEHLKILAALAERNKTRARALLQDHIRSSADFLIQHLGAVAAAEQVK
jgi:DNA-binding GntR family transcriptional regulator